uniref:Protein kinase domain-containing protein n=1 Tax=Phytophthora ramorum TaxID=164328 RepID=H3HE84_PHYRM
MKESLIGVFGFTRNVGPSIDHCNAEKNHRHAGRHHHIRSCKHHRHAGFHHLRACSNDFHTQLDHFIALGFNCGTDFRFEQRFQRLRYDIVAYCFDASTGSIERRLRMSSIGHVRLGATGNIPVFNTQGTERFETSSTSGGYGEVYRGLYREEPVAVKVLLPEKQKNLGQINAFLAEIKMMATIDHPCIVRFHGVAWDSLSDLSAVMEFMEGGDLRSLLDRFEQEQRPRGFDLDKARIALQTAQALTYLHSLDPKVLHRDLKSRNILLSSELDAKLSDFGVARKYSFSSMTAGVGTSLWMAPEVMLGDRYDASADIFSFGVVLSELDSHVHPYAEARMTNSGQRVPDAALLQLVAMGRVSVEFSVNAPTMLADLGRACVRLNPTTRPSASEVHYQLQLLLQSFELYTDAHTNDSDTDAHDSDTDTHQCSTSSDYRDPGDYCIGIDKHDVDAYRHDHSHNCRDHGNLYIGTRFQLKFELELELCAGGDVVIQKDSHSSDSDASSGLTVVESSGGMSAGAVIGIVAGAVKQKMTPRSPSFDASYAMAPITLPAAHAIALESLTPSPEITIHNLNNFDRTVNLDSTANLDSTLRLESSTGSIKSIKSGKSSSSLWEDEVITAARIPMEKLVRKELISEGGHGAVYHGLYRGECVAMKVLLPEKRKDMRQINIFLSEIKMMATVEHPRIVRFVGVAWDALTDLCAVSEFMEGGDLLSQLRRFDRVEHRARGFDVDKAKIAVHVAQALTYLHSLEPVVLHRDLKSMNILLNSDGDAKLTDFGVSRKWTVDTMTAGVGTRRWMAPEVMMGKRYDTSADIFSFGVVLSELDSHQPPYASAIATITSESGEKVTETALMEMVAMGRIRVDFSENAPSALVSLGHACVNLDPSSRPSAGEVHYQLQQILRTYQQYTL